MLTNRRFISTQARRRSPRLFSAALGDGTWRSRQAPRDQDGVTSWPRSHRVAPSHRMMISGRVLDQWIAPEAGTSAPCGIITRLGSGTSMMIARITLFNIPRLLFALHRNVR
jgi:hypothetical protein